MNLSTIATSACQMVRKSDAVTVAFAKTRISQIYNQIWDSELWRESLVMVTTTLDPTNAAANNGLDAIGVWLLPSIASKVVALRDHDRQYRVRNIEEYFRIDPDQFGQSGTGVEFNILPSCVMAMSPDLANVGALFYAQLVDPTDNPTINIRALDTNFTVEDITTSMTGSAIKALTNGNASELSTFTKLATKQPVNLGISNGAVSTVFATLNATDTTIFQRRRLQIVQLPRKAVNLRALVKRTIPPYTADQDIAQIKQLDEVLMWKLAGDLEFQQRQAQKAEALWAKSDALLGSVKHGEVYQQANAPRVIPDAEPYYDQDFNPAAGWMPWLRGPSA